MVDVLLIDDESPFLETLAEGLRLSSRKIEVLTADSAEKALEILRTAIIDVVVTDLNMPGLNGYELLARMEQTHPHVPVIIMSAYARASAEKKLKDLRFAEYCEKPLDLQEITRTILAAAVHTRPVGQKWRTGPGLNAGSGKGTND